LVVQEPAVDSSGPTKDGSTSGSTETADPKLAVIIPELFSPMISGRDGNTKTSGSKQQEASTDDRERRTSGNDTDIQVISESNTGRADVDTSGLVVQEPAVDSSGPTKDGSTSGSTETADPKLAVIIPELTSD
jgi:hypothetical protein